jgi:hypothetical protein
MLYELPLGSEVVGENWDDYTTPAQTTPDSINQQQYQEALVYLRNKIDRVTILVSSEYNSVVNVLQERPKVAEDLINLRNYLASCPELQKKDGE